MSYSPKTVFFGGSFDPFHNGHLQMARASKDYLGVDHIRLLIHPYSAKHGVASVDLRKLYHRIEMLLAVCRVYDFLHLDLTEVLIDSRYTVTSLSWLERQLGITRPSFILGFDQWLKLPTWQQATDVCTMAKWLVFRRAGEQGELVDEQKTQQKLQAMGACSEMMTAPIDTVSSTEIRHLLSHGQPADHLIPPPIQEYLHLYPVYD